MTGSTAATPPRPARAGGVARQQETSTVDFPTEAEPTPGGNVQLVEQYGQLTAVVVPVKRAFGRKDLRKSHFVTCPQADQWRRR